MKNFFPEFKKFITRGNVVDMSVGVIVGGAFTAIVNGMGNFILKPVVNWILALVFGANSLSEIFTFLKTSYKDVLDEAGNVIGTEIDLAQSIYIDWGAFINAVLNFFITAFVLFTIVKILNKLREGRGELEKGKLTREQRKELKANGIKAHDKDAAKAYFDKKKADEAAAAAAAAEAAAEAARLEREANPTTEDLLKLILAELKNK
ncbi:MAG: large conductance mechanosensitive channel protein MscL [Clostridia bacterium]|nr:large conductance mechanosensitive channel protein MscL [Clostridia bacterium]